MKIEDDRRRIMLTSLGALTAIMIGIVVALSGGAR